MDWYMKAMKRYVDFGGRSQRAEFWMFFLFNMLIGIALGVAAMLAGGPESGAGKLFMTLSNVYSLVVLLPGIAVSIRRLHDTNRSGWWLLIALIPLIGAIILIVFYAQDSQPGVNQYGPNPKGF